MLKSTESKIQAIIESFKIAIQSKRNIANEETDFDVNVDYDSTTKTGRITIMPPLKTLNLASQGITVIEENDLAEWVKKILMEKVLPYIPIH